MNARRMPALGLAVLAALTGCAQLTDRVILLPGPDGQAGAVEIPSIVSAAKVRLDQPFAQAEIRGGRIESGVTTRQAVDKAYGELSQVQPARPRSFVVRFQANSDQLTVESGPSLAGVARELISVAGRGDCEPLVPTADEVAEAGNRRVEIKLR